MRRSRLRSVSLKRRRDLRVRAAVQVEVLERDGGCRGRGVLPTVGCAGRLEFHELVRRSQWPAGWLVPSNVVLLCSAHHRFVTLNPEAGHDVDLVRWSWEPRPEAMS